MNKREAVLSLLDGGKKQEYIPAAFFKHFEKPYRLGQGAIDKHLEYFRYTGMDILKIQNENRFPLVPDIRKPEDWAKMPLYKKDFHEPQVKVVKGLVKEAKKEALVLFTLYSPFIYAEQTSDKKSTEHLRENPEAVKKGLEIITESTLLLVKECIKAGVDGFYASTQGGESFRFKDSSLFNEYIKPYDLAVMNEINRSCIFNVLHVCDYHGPYDDISNYQDYPGHMVNASLKLTSKETTCKEIYNLFKRPFLGGLERKGTIYSGSEDEIKETVTNVLNEAPEKFMLGADCTVPDDTNWDNLKTAISAAHEYERA